jgi:DNA-binding protein HU-beta
VNKTELIAAVAEKAGLTKKDVEKAVAALLETVKGEVAKKGKVQLIGFGTFEARTRNARTGKNPRTNEPIKIPAATVPALPTTGKTRVSSTTLPCSSRSRFQSW